MSSKEDQDEGRDDPANWIWGIFYFNPKDKRIFPPKRDKYAGVDGKFCKPCFNRGHDCFISSHGFNNK